MTEQERKIEVDYFLTRLNDSSTVFLIREIASALKNGNGNESLDSDPWEDMNIGIDFPDFYIEEARLPLAEMKSLLYQWLETIRPGASEYTTDIEEIDSATMRQNWLLKFKTLGSDSGKERKVCESLTEWLRPLCFVQLCELKDCHYIIEQIDKELNGQSYHRKPFIKSSANLSIKINPPLFKIGNVSNDDGLNVGLNSAKQFLEEWIIFLNR